MEYTLDDLRSSFARLDQRTDQGEQLPDLVSEAGVRLQDVLYIAEQRGIRAALIATGDIKKLRTALAQDGPTPIGLTPEQEQIKTITGAGYLEAITATLMMVKKS